eukprot:GABV01008060.1.p2 GENE.GABV01008060.1~~GABV01008060.1.p2  ORF type:complete len:106 (-),score=14.86 GABV01008060.1:11-328(-)
MLAARIIVGIDSPQDVCLVAGRTFAQRAAYKFAQYTQAHHVSGRYTSGTFTNTNPKALFGTPMLDCQPTPAWINNPSKKPRTSTSPSSPSATLIRSSTTSTSPFH